MSYITIEPSASTIGVNETQEYNATAYWSNGTSFDIDSLASYEIVNEAVANMSSNIATGLTSGTTLITASYSGKVDHAVLSVNGSGSSESYTDQIPLYEGWNMISFGVEEASGPMEDVNITLEEGWNLIGHSGSVNVSHEDLEVESTSFSAMSSFGASGEYGAQSTGVEDKVQRQFITLDAEEGKYKLAPYHESTIQRNKAYWVYANESTNLTVPSAKAASAEDNVIQFSEITFSNGTVEVVGVLEAHYFAYGYEWVESVYEWDDDCTLDYCWDEVDWTEMGSKTISSWDGIFIKTAANVTILR